MKFSNSSIAWFFFALARASPAFLYIYLWAAAIYIGGGRAEKKETRALRHTLEYSPVGAGRPCDGMAGIDRADLKGGAAR